MAQSYYSLVIRARDSLFCNSVHLKSIWPVSWALKPGCLICLIWSSANLHIWSNLTPALSEVHLLIPIIRMWMILRIWQVHNDTALGPNKKTSLFQGLFIVYTFASLNLSFPPLRGDLILILGQTMAIPCLLLLLCTLVGTQAYDEVGQTYFRDVKIESTALHSCMTKEDRANNTARVWNCPDNFWSHFLVLIILLV